MTINVIDVNDPPVFTTDFPDTTINENQLFEWKYRASDPDQDTLVYGISELSIFYNNVWNKLSDFIGLAADSSSDQIAFRPTYEQAGKYRVIFYVTDGQAIVSDTTIITVKNINQKPEFTKILPDTSINNGAEFRYNFTATDSDNDDVIFGLLDTIPGLILQDNGELIWRLPEQTKSQYILDVFVSDKIDTNVTSATIQVEDVVSISRVGLGIPDEYSLGHNYPNPFNPRTTIKYGLPKRAKVKISIYDISGNLIKTILNEQKEAGYHKVIWNTNDVSTGVYIYRIQTDNFTDVKKCILMK